MGSNYGIILAAGEGKRMKSKFPKVLHKVCGKPIIDHVIKSLKESGVADFTVVVGHGADAVKSYLGQNVKTILQKEQLGTGHAVMCCREFLSGKEGNVIVLAGDVPLITGEILKKLLDYHNKNGFAATILSAKVDDALGFGRIIRKNNEVVKIVEDKDADGEEKAVKEVNSAIYCFEIKALLNALDKIKNNNKQGEYYLTDAIEIMKNDGLKVGAYLTNYNELMGTNSEKCEVPAVFMGVNSRFQLAQAEKILREKILIRHMDEGVTILDPNTTYIDDEVKIGMDTVIYPNTIIEGNTIIGEDCIIGPGTRITNSKVGNGVTIQNSVIIESSVGDRTKVGPFAYLRPESKIGKGAKIGDFVEIKKSEIGDNTKVSHLTYIGDATVGGSCNFGCGTVVVNYDGTNKNHTYIGDHAFIGCNTNLISPVKVGDNAYIAAGSTITDEVPGEALAIARARQVNKEGWVSKKGIWKK